MLNSNYSINLFSTDILGRIWKAEDPRLEMSLYLEELIRRVTGIIDSDSNFISTLTEFHLNNLIFLRKLLAADNPTENSQINILKNEIICELMNILSKLIQLSEESEEMTTIANNHPELEEGMREMTERDDNADILNYTLIHNKLDVIAISKSKLSILKQDLQSLLSKYSREQNSLYDLSIKKIEELLNYLNRSFFPFIKLYYYFSNIERDEETQRLEFIINKPLEIISLNSCISYIDHKEESSKKEMKRQEELKQKREEEERILRLEEQRKEQEKVRLKEEEARQKEMQNREKSYIDILNELSLNEETKRLISESVEKMHSEINSRIAERQKRLDDKLKDVEDLIKGKKK